MSGKNYMIDYELAPCSLCLGKSRIYEYNGLHFLGCENPKCDNYYKNENRDISELILYPPVCKLCGSEADVYNDDAVYFVGCTDPDCPNFYENRPFFSLQIGVESWQLDNA